MKKRLFLILTISILAIRVYSQDIYSSLFYNDFSALNPSYIGILDTKQITFYTSEYKNSDYNFSYSSGRAAINIPISKINSGIGVHAFYSKFDIISFLDFGIIYSFKYDITDKIRVSLGTNLSLLRNKIKGTITDFWNEYPEYINESAHLFNLDLGFWVSAYGFQIGLSNKHINEPSKEMYFLNDTTIFGIKSSMNLILNYDFHIAQKHTFSNSIIVYNLKNFTERKYFIINNQFKINNKFIIGLSTDIYKYKDIIANLSPNIGFNLSNKFDFIMSIDLIQINASDSKGNTVEAVLNYNF